MLSKRPDTADHDYLFKILIIGDSGVGKTSILQRFAKDYFSNAYVTTIGVDFQIRTIDVDSKRCKLQVWDTAGQDRFKCVVSSFYRGAHGILICFDITNGESFRNVDNWLEEVRRHCPDQTPVFIVGTKSDLVSQRAVPYTTVKAYIEKQGLSYIETSSKTSENIDNCFYDFTQTLVKHTDRMQTFLEEKENTKVDLSINTRPVSTGACMGYTCSI